MNERMFKMADVRTHARRITPEKLVTIPDDAVFKQLIEEGATPADLKMLKEKYQDIVREVVSRIFFPMLEEHVEKMTANRLGITDEELKTIRKIVLETETEPTDSENADITQKITEKIHHITPEIFNNLVTAVEQTIDPNAQDANLRLIQAQLERLMPYLLTRAKLQYEIEKKQFIDIKTEALNQQGLEQRFQAEIDRLNTFSLAPDSEINKNTDEHNRRCLLLIEFDIDEFKKINDDPQRGHAVGDEILKEVVMHLKKWLRIGDAIGRRGGDEFSILINDVPEQNIPNIKLKIRMAIREISNRDGGIISITGAVRKIKRGENITYRQASEEADIVSTMAKIIETGSLMDFPLTVTIDSSSEKEKKNFAEAIVKRRAKREINKYEQLLKQEKDRDKKIQLKHILSLIQQRISFDTQIELARMNLREGIYANLLNGSKK